MSDPLEEAYYKYVHPESSEGESDLACPNCGSKEINRKAGYMGEYRCKACGHFWRA